MKENVTQISAEKANKVFYCQVAKAMLTVLSAASLAPRVAASDSQSIAVPKSFKSQYICKSPYY